MAGNTAQRNGITRDTEGLGTCIRFNFVMNLPNFTILVSEQSILDGLEHQALTDPPWVPSPGLVVSSHRQVTKPQGLAAISPRMRLTGNHVR